MSIPSSPARRLRRVAAGASLIAFPALLIPQGLVDPAQGGTGEVMFRAATESGAALTTSAVLLMVSGFLMVPAVAGVLHLARDRGAGIANVGAALAVLGGFGHFGIAMYYLVSLPLAGGDRDAMVAYIDRLNETAAIGAIAGSLILCFGLGVVILPWAAWRAGALHWSIPAVTTVAALAQMTLPDADVTTGVVLVVLAAAYAVMGLRVLRMTDAEWDGVRPVDRAEAPVAA